MAAKSVLEVIIIEGVEWHKQREWQLDRICINILLSFLETIILYNSIYRNRLELL